MIRELSDLGKKIRTENAGKKIVHDAIKDEFFSIDLIIRSDGTFERFSVMEKRPTQAEAITAKKGKARLLVDKAEEILEYTDDKIIESFNNKGEVGAKKLASYLQTVKNKHKMFISKIDEYENLPELQPVLAFYRQNLFKGFAKAVSSFESQVEEKERGGNIAFRLIDKENRVHEEAAVYQAIIEKYERDQNQMKADYLKVCSVCGKADYPVADIVHNAIKRVPGDKEPAGGRKLISYNGDHNPFESYDMIGNENCQICTRCTIEYTEGLNWLLSTGPRIKNEKGKEYTAYTNRKNFGSDTAMVFWTRENSSLAEIDLLERPQAGNVANLIDSVVSGESGKGKYLETDMFYSCTLSGAAARIAVRDWIETSLTDFRKSIAQWFKDTAIESYNWDKKKNEIFYSRLYDLARSGLNENAENDTALSRIAAHLWNAALQNSIPPLWILTEVLKRIRVDMKNITPERAANRAALIRLILNRNNKGGIDMTEKLDVKNGEKAHLFGRVFALLETIQWESNERKDIGAGIRERFYSAASMTPASTLGTLMKLSTHHMTKLKTINPGRFVNLDKKLQEVISQIQGDLPTIFTLEDQGRFALGYYHQKQENFNS